MTKFAGWAGALVLAATLVGSGGCGSACVDQGGRIRVEIDAAPDLNDAGQGPQHVRYQVWAIQDAAMYEGADASTLANDKTLMEEGMGQVFANTKAWIKPSGSRKLAMSIALENQFTHVAIAVAYPEAKKTMVPLNCEENAGYSVDGGVHTVKFELGRNAVRLAGAGVEDGGED